MKLSQQDIFLSYFLCSVFPHCGTLPLSAHGPCTVERDILLNWSIKWHGGCADLINPGQCSSPHSCHQCTLVAETLVIIPRGSRNGKIYTFYSNLYNIRFVALLRLRWWVYDWFSIVLFWIYNGLRIFSPPWMHEQEAWQPWHIFSECWEEAGQHIPPGIIFFF